MKTLAAVLVEVGRPLELAELELPVLKPGQVLVEIAFSGVCHTQVLETRGRRGPDKFLPHGLGHEGSGRVRECGAGVAKVKPGDEVVLSWIKGAGADIPGAVYQWGTRTVNAGGLTTFAQYAVVSENRLTPRPPDVSWRAAAALGCAIPTGLGAVFNVAQPRPGQSLAVFGAGGVGLMAITAAGIAGCDPIIAVDLNPEKLPRARQWGATHAWPGGPEAVAAVRELCPGGVDFAVEATGHPTAMQQALQSVRAQGGAAVIIGNAPAGEPFSLDPGQLNQGKRLLGTWGGDNFPDRDYPRYGKLIRNGKVPADALFSHTYALTAINQALDDLEHGRVTRPIIDLALP